MPLSKLQRLRLRHRNLCMQGGNFCKKGGWTMFRAFLTEPWELNHIYLLPKKSTEENRHSHTGKIVSECFKGEDEIDFVLFTSKEARSTGEKTKMSNSYFSSASLCAFHWQRLAVFVFETYTQGSRELAEKHSKDSDSLVFFNSFRWFWVFLQLLFQNSLETT